MTRQHPAEHRRIVGWIVMQDGVVLAMLTNISFEVTVIKPKKRSRLYVPGLPDLGGTCSGYFLDEIPTLRDLAGPPIVVLFPHAHICWCGPAWIDVEEKDGGQFDADFCAAGSWESFA